MTSFVAHHGSLGSTVMLVQVLDQGAYDSWVLRMLGFNGLIRESVNFTDDEIHCSFLFDTQGLVRNGDEESMAAMFLVPSETHWGFLADFDVVAKLRLLSHHARIGMGTRPEIPIQDGGQLGKQCDGQGNIE